MSGSVRWTRGGNLRRQLLIAVLSALTSGCGGFFPTTLSPNPDQLMSNGQILALCGGGYGQAFSGALIGTLETMGGRLSAETKEAFMAGAIQQSTNMATADGVRLHQNILDCVERRLTERADAERRYKQTRGLDPEKPMADFVRYLYPEFSIEPSPPTALLNPAVPNSFKATMNARFYNAASTRLECNVEAFVIVEGDGDSGTDRIFTSSGVIVVAAGQSGFFPTSINIPAVDAPRRIKSRGAKALVCWPG